MNRKSFTLTLLMVAASLFLMIPGDRGGAQSDLEPVKHTFALVRTHPSQGDVREIEGGQAELFATENGITMNFRTAELEPGSMCSGGKQRVFLRLESG